MAPTRNDALQGTITLLILKSLDGHRRHGYAIAQFVITASREMLRVEEGSLYPALRRLEQQGWVRSEWTTSETNRRARVYTLTPAGRRQLQAEELQWQRLSQGVRHVLRFAE